MTTTKKQDAKQKDAKQKPKPAGTRTFREAFESQPEWDRPKLIDHMLRVSGLREPTVTSYLKAAKRAGQGVTGGRFHVVEAGGKLRKVEGQPEAPKSKSKPKSKPDPKAALKLAANQPEPKSKSKRKGGNKSAGAMERERGLEEQRMGKAAREKAKAASAKTDKPKKEKVRGRRVKA